MDQNPVNRDRLKGLLFDLDGTLLDSFPSHFEAYRITFDRLGVAFDRERFLAAYSPNWYHTYSSLGVPEEVWKRADEYWLEAAAAQMPDLFSGVVETLAHLYGRYRLGIVTSGTKSRVMRDLDRTGIRQHFEVVVTGDDVPRPKPAPDGLHIALEVLALATDEVVYVGDALADLEMATAARVRFVGVQSEFASLDAVEDCLRVASIRDLPQTLD